MTDKQIIIDGCDVSGCVKLRPYNECGCQPNYGGSYGLCSEWGNCHYKQLKRKEQECEALKLENKELKEKLENHCFDCDVAERMAKVTYAATGGRLSYSNYTVEAIEQAYNDQLRIDVEYRTKELEQELEQYKKSKQASYEQFQKRCNELELENRKFRELLITLDEEEFVYEISEIEFRRYLKLKQTLIEIKEIAEDKSYVGFWDEQITEILNKISEVEDG